MSMTDENALYQDLTDEFDLLIPGPAPVDATIRQGRGIRAARRRATLAGSLAAVAVLGVAAPIVIGQRGGGTAGPVGPGTHRVVVDTPHTNAKGQLVVSGSVDGKVWSETTTQDGCFMSFGSCVQRTPPPTSPVDLGAMTDSVNPDIYEAYFRADTARLGVDLADGEHITVEPVSIGDSRFAAFKVPRGLQLTRATAYAADGAEIAYSIPFNRPRSSSSTVTWYRPGEQPTQVPASGPILTGTTDGVKWEVDAEVGPFGVCVVDVHVPTGMPNGSVDDDFSCFPLHQVDETTPSWGPGPFDLPYLVKAAIRSDVARIDVVLSDGSTDHLGPVRVGGYSFVAVRVPAHVTVTSMTPYDSAGEPLPVVGGQIGPK